MWGVGNIHPPTKTSEMGPKLRCWEQKEKWSGRFGVETLKDQDCIWPWQPVLPWLEARHIQALPALLFWPETTTSKNVQVPCTLYWSPAFTSPPLPPAPLLLPPPPSIPLPLPFFSLLLKPEHLFYDQLKASRETLQRLPSSDWDSFTESMSELEIDHF